MSAAHWPPNAPDAGPLDFYVHGAMVNEVYRTPIINMDDLNIRILHEFRNLRVDDCRRAIGSVFERMIAMVNAGGDHFDLRL